MNNWIYHLSKKKILIIGFALLIITGYFDFRTGYEVRFSGLYFIALFLITISASKPVRLITALSTSIFTIITDFISKPENMSSEIFIWNILMKLILYIGFPQIMSLYFKAKEKETYLAMRDSLTGLYNRRTFFKLAELEIQRSLRYNHAFSVAYIDCDNFKYINDNFGHNVGDILLKTIGETLSTKVRNTDIVARLGGDEFIIFFTETKMQSILANQLLKSLTDKMYENNWPVSFSIGIAVFSNISDTLTLEETIQKADSLMYEVKKSGKNAARIRSFIGQQNLKNIKGL